MSIKYVVELEASERDILQKMIKNPKVAYRKRLHAQVLLKADESLEGPSWTDRRISDSFDLSEVSISRIRKRFVEHGLDDALERRLNPTGAQKHKKLDGAGEARLFKIACSTAPKGHNRWTMQLLADQIVKLHYVDSISDETVRTTLKKMKSNLG